MIFVRKSRERKVNCLEKYIAFIEFYMSREKKLVGKDKRFVFIKHYVLNFGGTVFGIYVNGLKCKQ